MIALDKITALVLIDLQKGILQRPTAHPIHDVLHHAAVLVDAFRNANLPIIVVNVIPGGAWLTTRKDAKAAPSTPLPSDFSEITPEIRTQPSDIFITKESWNAFYNTSLHSELQKRNITGIVLAGVSTSAGVESTARSACERGYNVAFATDAITDTNGEAHKNSLLNVFPRIGQLGTTREVIAEIWK